MMSSVELCAPGRMELPLSEVQDTEEELVRRENYKQLSLRQVKFEMPVRHASHMSSRQLDRQTCTGEGSGW